MDNAVASLLWLALAIFAILFCVYGCSLLRSCIERRSLDSHQSIQKHQSIQNEQQKYLVQASMTWP